MKFALRAVARVDILDELSGLEPDTGGWFMPAHLAQSLSTLLEEIDRVYGLVLHANTKVLSKGIEKSVCEVHGRPWTQSSFTYQGSWLI